MQPDLELVTVRSDESFTAWYHGYPYRTVRWHFHPEYEIQLMVATTGKMFVGDHIGRFGPGNLVLMGPNLPHNWISDVADGEVVEQRNLIIQFGQEFVTRSMQSFPELRQAEALLAASRRGVSFGMQTSEIVKPLMYELLDARGVRRIALFMSILATLIGAQDVDYLASPSYQPDPTAFAATRISHALSFIGQNLSSELRESDLAQLSGQSISAFSRYFRRHTGMTFVQYVNRMRIDLACHLLMNDALSITDICYKVGFNTLSNFNQRFLIIKGMAPSEFRRNQRLNGASRDASEAEAARGRGIANAPSIIAADASPFRARMTPSARPST